MTSVESEFIPQPSFTQAVESMRRHSLLRPSFSSLSSSSSSSDTLDCPGLSFSSSTSSGTLTDDSSPPLSPIKEEETDWASKLSSSTILTPRVRVYEPDSYTDTMTPRPSPVQRRTSMSACLGGSNAREDAGYESESEEKAVMKRSPKLMRSVHTRSRPPTSSSSGSGTLARAQKPTQIDLSLLPDIAVKPRDTKRYVGLGLGLPSTSASATSRVSENLADPLAVTVSPGESTLSPKSPLHLLAEPRVPRRSIGLGLRLPSSNASRSSKDANSPEWPTLPAQAPGEPYPPSGRLSSGPFVPLVPSSSVKRLQLHPTALPDSFSPSDPLPSPLISQNLFTQAREPASLRFAQLLHATTNPISIDAFLTLANLASRSVVPLSSEDGPFRLYPNVMPDLFSPMDILPSPLVSRGAFALARVSDSLPLPALDSSTAGPVSIGAFLTLANLAAHNKQLFRASTILPESLSPLEDCSSPCMSLGSLTLAREPAPLFITDLDTTPAGPVPSDTFRPEVDLVDDTEDHDSHQPTQPIKSSTSRSCPSPSPPFVASTSCSANDGCLELLPSTLCDAFSPVENLPSPFPLRYTAPSPPSESVNFPFPTLALTATGPMYMGAFLTLANLANHDTERSGVPARASPSLRTRSSTRDRMSTLSSLESSSPAPRSCELVGTPTGSLDAWAFEDVERDSLIQAAKAEALRKMYSPYFAEVDY